MSRLAFTFAASLLMAGCYGTPLREMLSGNAANDLAFLANERQQAELRYQRTGGVTVVSLLGGQSHRERINEIRLLEIEIIRRCQTEITPDCMEVIPTEEEEEYKGGRFE